MHPHLDETIVIAQVTGGGSRTQIAPAIDITMAQKAIMHLINVPSKHSHGHLPTDP
jgi:hypothetical protein